jgi:hypothetical protein
MKRLKFIKGAGGSLARDKHRTHGPPGKATRDPWVMEDLVYYYASIPGDLGIYSACKMDHESCRTDLGLRLAREL